MRRSVKDVREGRNRRPEDEGFKSPQRLCVFLKQRYALFGHRHQRHFISGCVFA